VIWLLAACCIANWQTLSQISDIPVVLATGRTVRLQLSDVGLAQARAAEITCCVILATVENFFTLATV
jgi:hypothetical protein